jgi:hypothetical protein
MLVAAADPLLAPLPDATGETFQDHAHRHRCSVAPWSDTDIGDVVALFGPAGGEAAVGKQRLGGLPLAYAQGTRR